MTLRRTHGYTGGDAGSEVKLSINASDEAFQRGVAQLDQNGGDEIMATAVRALGEVALCVNDLDKSQAFYEHVITLELMRRSSTAKPPSSRRIARSTIWRSP
jgi:hypothetical protein